MPRTRSLAWAELKIGLVSIVAIVMAVVLIFLLGGEGGFFWQRYPLKTVFSNIAGLKAGSPVRIAGVEVGSVTDVAFSGDQVEVVMEVNRERQPLVTSTSVATLGTVSLLGEAAVDITASTEGTPIAEWGYVPSERATGSLGSVAEQAEAGLEQLSGLLGDLRNGQGTAGKLLTDEGLYQEITAFLSAAEQVTSGINDGRGTLGRLATDPAAAMALEASMANLEMVTARIRAGEGSLGQLLTDDALSQSVTSATTNLDAITDRINRGEGTAGKLLSDDELYSRLTSMAERLDNVMGALEQGEGTAGQMLRDRQLYENMNGAVSELRSLVQDIREDPRRYLNVRVSLF